MANKDKFCIPIEGKLVEVDENVYVAYYEMGRRERYLGERDRIKGVVSYDALDNGSRVGEAAMPDCISESMEDKLLTSELYEQLHHCIEALPRAERELIHAIYFDGLTEQEYAQKVKMTQSGISRKRKKILSKLRMFSDILGRF